MKPVVVFGIGDFAEQVLFYLEHDSPCQVAAFSVDQAYLRETSFKGRPVAPFETLERDYPPDDYDVFVAMGYNDLNRLRAERIALVRSKGYRMINYIHSSALIPNDLRIGENCFFLEKVVVQPFTRIGDGVVILTDTGLGHNADVGDCCYISGGCCIAAFVSFGPRCFVSLNATFRPGVKIGHSVIVGAGALMLEDAPDESVYIAKGTARAPRGSRLYKRFI
ncbi:MAG: acetyltransferase [Kiritimatiellia bacterium]|nr:acetyltransferase [Lentisphaerota bacterium]